MVTVQGKYHTNGGHHAFSPKSQYPHSMLEASMTRTLNPKYASYMGDGGGRDSYIITSNGGLANSNKAHMMKTHWRPKKDNSVRPTKPMFPLNYRADGSGRDTYVVSNSGGLVYDYKGVKTEEVFKGSLRHNPRPMINLSPSRNRLGSEITDYLNWMTPKDQYALKAKVRAQRNLIERLSPTNKVTKFAGEKIVSK